jgi:nickel-dependent lactate racemase
MKVCFPYWGMEPLEVQDSALAAYLKPKISSEQNISANELIRRGLSQPVGVLPLRETVKPHYKILILVDDYTRMTPAHLILPEIEQELISAGVQQINITLLVASGTHRTMSEEEKRQKYGHRITAQYKILNHLWNKEEELIQLPSTKNGTEVWVNKILKEADFILGLGHIVPHRVSGFSGGAKIVQPGVCGGITTGQTHWLSALYEGSQIMGRIDNPIRNEINEVGIKAGLQYIVNPVLDGEGNIVRCFCGDPIKAFREGCKTSLDIFGAELEEPVDIVIADSYPADVELWQASKGIYSADLALKQGGVLIIITPCPEGISTEHPQIADIGYRPFKEVESMVHNSEIKDLTMAAHLVHVGRVIRDKGVGILVSPGIDREKTTKLGFKWAETPQKALELAFSIKGRNASVAVLKNGGEVMPLLSSKLKKSQTDIA